MVDVNSTASLLGAFGIMDRPNPVMLNMFFPFEQTFETREVYFDKVQRARRLAPFVVPTIEGKPMPSRGYTTMGFKPPYVKPKHVVEPVNAIQRRAGEQIFVGSLTPQQRFEAAIMDNMMLEDTDITRREEWMATELLLTGAVTCASVDHPPVIIDLQRNAAHTVVLSGGLTWGSTGVDPLQNMQDWAATVAANSGYHPGVVIMDPKAGRLFTKSPGVLQVMNSFRQTEGNVNLAGVVTGGAPGSEILRIGTIGMFEVWQYQQFYMDDSGVIQKFIPDNTIIMGNPFGASGVRCYGAILDVDATLKPFSRFPKAWKAEDPSAWMTMTQSAPLPLMGWIDATFSAKVA